VEIRLALCTQGWGTVYYLWVDDVITIIIRRDISFIFLHKLNDAFVYFMVKCQVLNLHHCVVLLNSKF
jgi:hypothetical protein